MPQYVDKPISLIERKKQQWAKEREEQAGLFAPWPSSQTLDKSFGRNIHVSKLLMTKNDVFRKEITPRRSSLPPLYKNLQNVSEKEQEMGGETSGYGSDNANVNNDVSQNWNQFDESTCAEKFWDSKDTPNWVKRGLQSDHEIVVFNTSPAESPQHDEIDVDRPFTSNSATMNRNHMRGQNIPLDSLELAERERKRQIALAHQEAIRQQLEEREKRRREERERKIKEEQEEELRIEREQQIERQRKEEELRVAKEKLDRERKRNEAIQEALESAEKEAKMEKIKLKMKKNNQRNVLEAEEGRPEKIHNNLEKEEKNTNKDQQQNNLVISPKQDNLLKDSINSEPHNNVKTINIDTSLESSSYGNSHKNSIVSIVASPRGDNLALVLPNSIESLPNFHYAVLLPSLTGPSTSSTIAVPLALPTTDGYNSARTENRILTPTQYRNKNRRTCDSATQTDTSEYMGKDDGSRFIKEKFDNLDLNYEKRRKDKFLRSENRDVERPKWGANRPPTRYLKQSEKDPLYQRRKMRQKVRDVKYDYRNSSDDSRVGSPITYRKKNYMEKRNTRALWRKTDHVFARNIRMYQTEIVPLESDKERIYYKKHCECCCRCSNGRISQLSKTKAQSEILRIEHSEEKLPDCSNTSSANSTDMLERLGALHDNLSLKHEQWERSPRTPSLSSSTRNTENN